ncbi:MAG: C39 family peptidase [Candidatus Heimdallarchaeota archaeon]|nr:C39 family peptidase [Candidatus Heimdallarchaeota archaeon]
MKPTRILNIPMVRQSTNYTCGVAALQSVLKFYGFDEREDKLAEKLNATLEGGTPRWNITAYAEKLGISVKEKQLMTIEELEQNIQDSHPTIITIQAWAGESNPDWSNRWEDGHYVVCIGYDEENLYFMDPSTLGNYTYIPKSELLSRWHDIDQNEEKVIQYGIRFMGQQKYSSDQYIRLC